MSQEVFRGAHGVVYYGKTFFAAHDPQQVVIYGVRRGVRCSVRLTVVCRLRGVQRDDLRQEIIKAPGLEYPARQDVGTRQDADGGPFSVMYQIWQFSLHFS